MITFKFWFKMSTPGDDTQKKKKKRPELPVVPIKTTADYQRSVTEATTVVHLVEAKVPMLIGSFVRNFRMKLERLMANPNKPAFIPEPPKNKDLPPPPEFVRNIMGSSAGAG